MTVGALSLLYNICINQFGLKVNRCSNIDCGRLGSRAE